MVLALVGLSAVTAHFLGVRLLLLLCLSAGDGAQGLAQARQALHPGPRCALAS
jgi:hypothetical protein